jgi:Uma2 family endonuclease
MSKNISYKPRIGFSFDEYVDRGVVLQMCKTLPKHHNRQDEIGPFYGVSYNSGKYIWYSEKEMTQLLKNV